MTQTEQRLINVLQDTLEAMWTYRTLVSEPLCENMTKRIELLQHEIDQARKA
jgi:hypothetical protein